MRMNNGRARRMLLFDTFHIIAERIFSTGRSRKRYIEDKLTMNSETPIQMPEARQTVKLIKMNSNA